MKTDVVQHVQAKASDDNQSLSNPRQYSSFQINYENDMTCMKMNGEKTNPIKRVQTMQKTLFKDLILNSDPDI